MTFPELRNSTVVEKQNQAHHKAFLLSVFLNPWQDHFITFQYIIPLVYS